MDLKGPADDDSRLNNTQEHIQGNAWVECGNKTDAELLDINLTNTGPEYMEVYENVDDTAFTQAIVPGNWHDDNL